MLYLLLDFRLDNEAAVGGEEARSLTDEVQHLKEQLLVRPHTPHTHTHTHTHTHVPSSEILSQCHCIGMGRGRGRRRGSRRRKQEASDFDHLTSALPYIPSRPTHDSTRLSLLPSYLYRHHRHGLVHYVDMPYVQVLLFDLNAE